MQSALQSRSLRAKPSMKFLSYRFLAVLCFLISSVYSVHAQNITTSPPLTLSGNLSVLQNATVGYAYGPVKFSSNITTQKAVWSAKNLPPGLTFNQLGVLSGVATWDSKWSIGNATTTRNFTVSFSVKGLPSNDGPLPVLITVVKTTPPTITTTQLPAGKMDVRYANPGNDIGFILSATGGIPFPVPPKPTGYNWALMSGKLPRGMTFNSVGALSGIPTQQGSFTLKFRATDAVGQFAEKTFTLFIGPPEPPQIITDCPLPEGLEKLKYPNVGIYAQNGKKPYKWSISVGALPPGLVLENTSYSVGFVKGTPTVRGNFTFTLSVTDANGMSATKNCSIKIRPSPEIIVRDIFKCARVGETACEQIEAFGGDLPYKWEVQGLPPGLSIDQNTGKICGNFTVPGNFTIPITVTEASTNKDVEIFTFVVKPALQITTPSLDFGIKGSPYPKKTGTPTSMIEVTGGWPSYSWQVIIGILPPGLQLNPNTGAITGTPTKTGTYRFTVRVKDSCETPAKWVDKEYEITIYDPITVFPDPLSCLTVNRSFSANFTASGGASPYDWQIVSLSSGSYSLAPDSNNSKIGRFTGTPSQAGPLSIGIQVTSLGLTESFTINYTVNPELKITSDCPPPEATVGREYFSQNLTATGGSGNLTWNATVTRNGTVISGSGVVGGKVRWLPPNPIGGFTGSGDASGIAHKVAIDVRDECGNTDRKECDVTLYPALGIPVCNSPCLYNGMTLNATQLFSVSGGKPPYSYSTLPNLPNNLVFSEDGFLSGTINATGNFTVLTTIGDSLGNTRSANCTIPIYPKLVIATPSPLPVAYIGSNYSTTINATGGKSCYTWTLNSNSVDPQDFGNLQIGNLTCNSSILTGVPKTVGNYTINVTATDACGQIGNETFTVQVKKSCFEDCLKGVWVVVEYIEGQGHGCNQDFFCVAANDTPILYANLNNGGGSLDDWGVNPGGAKVLIPNYSNGNGSESSFASPFGIALNTAGNEIYVADSDKMINRIRKITTNSTLSIKKYGNSTYSTVNFGNMTSNVTTFAGGDTDTTFSDGFGSNSSFSRPGGIAIDNSNTLFVADTGNHRIRKITSDGTVTTLAGNGTASFADGNGSSACFFSPKGVCVDQNGVVYVADTGNHRIRKITSDGTVTTLAGNGTASFANGNATATAMFKAPSAVAVSNGSVYVADTGNNIIRKINNGNVTAIAGKLTNPQAPNIPTVVTQSFTLNVTANKTNEIIVNISDPIEKPPNQLRDFNSLAPGTWVEVTIDNTTTSLTVDSIDFLKKIISLDNKIPGSGNGTLKFYSGNLTDGNGTESGFSSPTGISVYSDINGQNTIYVSDTGNNRIRMIKEENGNASVTTVAGVGTFILNSMRTIDKPFSGSGGPGRYNRIFLPLNILEMIGNRNGECKGATITFKAFCAQSSSNCSHSDGIGKLTVSTTDSENGDFSANLTSNNTINPFKPQTPKDVPLCTQLNLSPKVSLASATAISGPSFTKSSLVIAGEPSIHFEDPSMKIVTYAPGSSVSNSQEINNNALIQSSKFNVGIYEITNQQYAIFLNAVAKVDPNNLYNTSMQNIGIIRKSTDGFYSYLVHSGKEYYPVTFVSWYDAARYTNWIANGKPNASQSSGTTENGVYNLALSTIARNSINPNTSAPPKFWLLNESEWYTSAYLKTDGSALWHYPTQSNAAPDSTGKTPSNFANFNGVFGETTLVGFFDQSPGPFGTFDQAGNVREWTETLDTSSGTSMRIIRGGSWADPASSMRADESQIAYPTLEDNKTGFRIGGAP